MTTTAIQPTLQPQVPVSASTPNAQGRFSLNCTAFIKLVATVTSIAATVIACFAEQYLIATLTASLAAFAIYSYFRGEPSSAPQNSTVTPTPGQTPNPLPLNNPPSGTQNPTPGQTSNPLPPLPLQNQPGGSENPTPGQTPDPLQPLPLPNQTGGAENSTSGQTPDPLLLLPLQNQPGGSGSPVTSPEASPRSESSSSSVSGLSSGNSTPRSGSENVDDLDENKALLGETPSQPLTPIDRTVATLQSEIFATAIAGGSINSSNNSSNSSSLTPSRSASERNLAALDLADTTTLSPLRGGNYVPRNIRKAQPDSSSSDEEGSVVERTDLEQGSDPREVVTTQPIIPEHASTQTAGGDSENDTVGALITTTNSAPKSVVRSLTAEFNEGIEGAVVHRVEAGAEGQPVDTANDDPLLFGNISFIFDDPSDESK